MTQANLMDMNLKFKKGVDFKGRSNLSTMNLKSSKKNIMDEFKDESLERINKLVWNSPKKQTFCYDDNGDMKLTTLKLNLKGARRLNKKGKFDFVLEREWDYDGIEEKIIDDVLCHKLPDLESCFNDEIFMFESDLTLPKDVLFDGHRYCWKFKEVKGKIRLLEKWLPKAK